MTETRRSAHAETGELSRSPREQGWALLGLILALGIMSIVLVSSVVPNVQTLVKSDRELELLFRGDEMAKGIAIYYSQSRRLAPLNVGNPPGWGYLLDLKKLGSGINIGGVDLKFVRPSAMINPMNNKEWEPVRMRDPRLMKVLQAWAAYTGAPIPPQYLLLAAPPAKISQNLGGIGITGTGGATGAPGQQQGINGIGNPGQGAPTGVNGNPNPGGSSTGAIQIPAPGQGIRPAPGTNRNRVVDDDDDDDDDGVTPPDPFARFFGQQGKDNVPIVGVAPKIKGTAVHSLYGLDKYEEWVFIYIPDPTLQLQQLRPNQNLQNPNNQRGNGPGSSNGGLQNPRSPLN